MDCLFFLFKIVCMKTEIPPGKEEILEKLRYFCAIQERSPRQLTEKLFRLQLTADKHPWFVQQLKEGGFINDKRFAFLFVRSKMNQNHWGCIKIRYELLSHGIPAEIIEEALKEIDEADYLALITKLAKEKEKSIKDQDPYIRKQKILAFLSSKGFEPNLILDCLKLIKQ